MLNFARFIPGTPDADWLRQQVSERGILEKIDTINEFVNKALKAHGMMPEEFWQVLDMVEESLRKNMNDPRAKMLAMSYGTIENKENKKEQPKRKVKTIDDPDGTDAPEGTIVGTDPDGGVTGEPGPEGDPTKLDPTLIPGTPGPKVSGEPTGEPDPTENAEGPANDTQEPTDEGTKEPVGEPDPAEKVDTTEPTDEGTKEPTGEPADESTNETPEPTTETPETKKGGRKKKNTE